MTSIKKKYYGITITLKPENYHLTANRQYHISYDHLQYVFGHNSLIVAELTVKGNVHYHIYHESPMDPIEVYKWVKLMISKYGNEDQFVFGFIKVSVLKTQKDRIKQIEYMLKNPYVNQTLCQECVQESLSPIIPKPEKCLFVDDEGDTVI